MGKLPATPHPHRDMASGRSRATSADGSGLVVHDAGWRQPHRSQNIFVSVSQRIVGMLLS